MARKMGYGNSLNFCDVVLFAAALGCLVSAAACRSDDSQSCTLRLVFTDQATRQKSDQVECWALEPEGHGCQELLSGKLSPSLLSADSHALVELGAQDETSLPSVPQETLLFYAQGLGAGVPLAAGCSHAHVSPGQDVTILMNDAQPCQANASRPCKCEDGKTGVELCAADQRYWKKCQCLPEEQDASVLWEDSGALESISAEESNQDLVPDAARPQEDGGAWFDDASVGDVSSADTLSGEDNGLDGDQTSQSKVLVAKKTVCPMTIDGLLSEYTQANSIQFSDDPSRGTDANSATVWVLWDESNFYMAYEVKDTKLNSSTAVDIFRNDNLEIYIDRLHDHQPYRDSDDHHFIVSIENVFWGGEENVAPDLVRYAVSLDGTLNDNQDEDVGYRIEFAVAWTALNGLPAVGSSMGMDFCAADRDPPQFTYQYFDWMGLYQFDLPDQWGEVTLSDQLAEPCP